MGKYSPVPFYEDHKKSVVIVSINPDLGIAIGNNIRDGRIEIVLDRSPSGILVVPAIGEEWIVERQWDEWVLHSRTDWQNSLYAGNLVPGEIRIGGSPKVTIQADSIKLKSATTVERTATLNPSVIGFIKYQVSPIGEVYCWGELAITAFSGSPTLRHLGTIANQVNTPVIPSSRRIWSGAAGTANGYKGTLVQLDLDGKIQAYTVGGETTSSFYFSTSWFIPQ